MAQVSPVKGIKSKLLFTDEKVDGQTIKVKEELFDSNFNKEPYNSFNSQNCTQDIKTSCYGPTKLEEQRLLKPLSANKLLYSPYKHSLKSTSSLSRIVKREALEQTEEIVSVSCDEDIKREKIEEESKINENSEEASCITALRVKVEVHSPLIRSRVEKFLPQQFACDVCDESYESKTILIEHMKVHVSRKIPQVKPYSCEFCDKSFTRKQSLVDHKKVHIYGRFSCDVCDKSFARTSSLKAHKMIHSGIKPYECDVCGKTYVRKDNLNEHKLLHMPSVKPFKCEVCDKSFKWRSSLNAHKDMHTAIKQFTCKVCSKSFTWKSSFKLHKQTHLLVKPYSCVLCNKNFACKGEIRKHITLHS